jgi:hypothetical protein
MRYISWNYWSFNRWTWTRCHSFWTNCFLILICFAVIWIIWITLVKLEQFEEECNQIYSLILNNLNKSVIKSNKITLCLPINAFLFYLNYFRVNYFAGFDYTLIFKFIFLWFVPNFMTSIIKEFWLHVLIENKEVSNFLLHKMIYIK